MPTTPNKGYSYPVHGGAVNSWDTDLDAIFNYIDLNVAGPYPLTITSTGAAVTYNSSGAVVGSAAATITPPSSLAQNLYYKLTGAMTNDIDLTLPAAGGIYVVNNSATGGFTLRAVASGSTAVNVACAQNETKTIVCNGSDMVTANTASNSWAGATYAGSDVSPAAISSDQNDYNPTDLSITTCLRLNVTAACSITGLAGGAAGRDLELVNIGTATAKFPANSISSSAANRFANTFNLFPGQSIFLRYDATSSLWRPKNVATAFSSCAMAGVSGDLLITNTATPDTILNISMSEATLVDSAGNGIKFENISVSVNSASTGPGGCDTGTRGASKQYTTWLVSDGVSINAVISLGTTAATVLTNLTTSGSANYIYMKRIGATFTNASSNFQRVRQTWRRAEYIVSAATTTAYPTAGTTSGTALTAITVVGVGLVPTTAVALYFYLGNTSNSTLTAAPNNVSTTAFAVNPSPFQASQPGTSGTGLSGNAILQGTTFYAACNSGTATLFIVGWDDNI